MSTLSQFVRRQPQLIFWLLFASLNVLLFVPLYYAFRFEATFWPSFRGEIGDGSLRWYLIKYGVIRQNADMFRLSLEWLWLVALWVWIRPLRRPVSRYVVTALYIFGFIYNTYDTLIFAIYNEYPNLYDDALLVINGITGLTRHIGIPFYVYPLIVASIALFFYLCAWLIKQLLAPERIDSLGRLSHGLLAVLVLYSAVMVWQYTPFLDHPRINASSIAAKFRRNLDQSASTYQNRQQLLAVREQLPTAYVYDSYSLQTKPDIYIIFIESYGDAIYQFEDIRAAYTQRTRTLEETLNQHGWQIRTIRSEAPIRGGKSWLSYTSLLFGLRVDDEAQYNVMLNTFDDVAYPHLGRYLQSQGYDYQRVTPLLAEAQDRPKWEQTQQFMGYDDWWFLNDMTSFSGRTYGWGPSPPDQYTLSFLRDVTESNRPNTPHLYFYITHNSHLPWVEPPEVVADWRSLATAEAVPAAGYNPYHETKEAYIAAIYYQLEMVNQLVMTGPDDALYIVVGDHQPPLRAFSDYDGPATPMHIISRDTSLLQRFEQQQFTPGYLLTDATIKHEGFYSLFMRILLTEYGRYQEDELPPVLPDGLDLSTLANSQ